MTRTLNQLAAAVFIAAAGFPATLPVLAATAARPAAAAASHHAPAAGRTARKPAPAPKPVEPPPPTEADAEQLETAEKVYYGVYECEFKQSVDIVHSPRYPGYVDVKHAKALWLMKPVLSSTGAIRLEDVRGETLMVQIASKSMLLNVKTGHRIVDDCVSPRQRELIDAAREAKAAAVAAAAASAAASAPGTPTAAKAEPGAAASAAPSMMSIPTPVAPTASSAR